MSEKLCSLEEFKEDFRNIKSRYIPEIFKKLEKDKMEFYLNQDKKIKKFIRACLKTICYHINSQINVIY
jgi:hypothetical protein